MATGIAGNGGSENDNEGMMLMSSDGMPRLNVGKDGIVGIGIAGSGGIENDNEGMMLVSIDGMPSVSVGKDGIVGIGIEGRGGREKLRKEQALKVYIA